jgi:hypothetical protein
MCTDIMSAIRNAKGSTLVMVLIVMTAISIFGIIGLSISNVELEISSNERQMREVFYLSEGAALEGAQRLVNAPPIDLEDKIYPWHHDETTTAQNTLDFRDPQQWDFDGHGEDNAMQSALDSQVYFAAVEHRLASGSSAVVTESRLYLNRVFGFCSRHNAAGVVEIGYQLRY